jgi:hypothetical protein
MNMTIEALLRVILLVIHIIAAGGWISAAAAEFIFGRLIKANEGKPSEVTLMRATVQYLGTVGSIAGPVVLLTGLGLTWVYRWSLLGIGGFTPTWLIIKQVIYIGLLFIVFVWIQPTSKRLAQAFTAADNDAPTATSEMRSLFERIMRMSNLHNLLVLTNIILAVWKPT